MQKLIPICPRKESVVPLRQSWVFEKVELGHHGIGDFDLSGVVLRIQGAFDLQTGLGSRFSNQAHNRWVIGQRLAGPVLADPAKEPVLDRVPLGCSGGIMTDGHSQLVNWPRKSGSLVTNFSRTNG